MSASEARQLLEVRLSLEPSATELAALAMDERGWAALCRAISALHWAEVEHEQLVQRAYQARPMGDDDDRRHAGAVAMPALPDERLEKAEKMAWNAVAERTFGWTREEALGQELASLIIPAADGSGVDLGGFNWIPYVIPFVWLFGTLGFAAYLTFKRDYPAVELDPLPFHNPSTDTPA